MRNQMRKEKAMVPNQYLAQALDHEQESPHLGYKSKDQVALVVWRCERFLDSSVKVLKPILVEALHPYVYKALYSTSS